MAASRTPRLKPVPPETLGLLAVALLLAAGCERPAAPTTQSVVVVYTALDREFSEPILDTFTRRTGIAVRAVYDTESTKTIGLVNRIRAERERPRCDVFWNNEILNTLRLKAEGLLETVELPEASAIPPQFRDPDRMWYGFAARARVILVNTQRLPADQRPRSIFDLTRPALRGRVGIAKPLFGTTASHVAALFAVLGPQKARQWLLDLKANDVRIVGGNRDAAQLVGDGALACALTDTDDAILERDAGKPVGIVLPDQQPGGLGALLLPNTVALIRGAPHREAGILLMRYLLSDEVEARLARGRSAQIPLRRGATARSRLPLPEKPHWMRLDYAAAAARFPAAAEFIEREFLAP